jgi:long-chain acyl-CoA synthetase
VRTGESIDYRDVYDAFARAAAERPHHPAVVYLGTSFDYARVLRMAEAFAAGLHAFGVESGERVLLYLPNSIQWVVAWLGVLRAGAVSVPVTPVYTPSDIAHIASDSGARTVICADTNYGYVVKAMRNSPLERAVVTNLADLLPWGKRLFGFLFDVVPRGDVGGATPRHSLRRLLALGAGRPLTAHVPPSAPEGGLLEIVYTGGTTRRPKGIPITQELFLRSNLPQIENCRPLVEPRDNVILLNSPLFHILGQACGLSALFVGATLLLQPRVNLDATFTIIERERARTMVAVPALYRMILEHDRVDQYDLSSVDYWLCGGDVLPEEVGKRWRARFGKPIFQGYGATETCGGVCICPADRESPPRSVGRVLPIKHIRLADPGTLEAVPPGSPGELWVSSEPMVKAYLNRPEETAASFVERDGRTWYRTGDLMSQDEAGNLYFVDRSADTIKHKGYRVSASEVEAVLQEHPAVTGACVIGVADEKLGERIKAFVVLREDVKGITGYDLIHWARERLPEYKLPQYIEFRDMLPKSKVGKLLRREMRDQERRRAEG